MKCVFKNVDQNWLEIGQMLIFSGIEYSSTFIYETRKLSIGFKIWFIGV